MSELLLARIRGEYREMPGLQLTFKQACRLWQLDAAECEGVLDALMKEQFLCRTMAGTFVALPTPRRAQTYALAIPKSVASSTMRTR